MRAFSLAAFVVMGCSSIHSFDGGGDLPPAARNPIGDPALDPKGGGTNGEPCRGWECQIVDCGGSPSTTIIGVVRDPAGKLPVADALVYVPNQLEAPFPNGGSCPNHCVMDKPLATVRTDSLGRFRLAKTPSGTNVPLVVQIGKWRRRVLVPTVKSCTDNPVAAELTRLPRTHLEGSIPKIAITTGCDELECFVMSLGVDASEITGPNGSGSVHVYRGKDSDQTLPASPGDASQLAANKVLLQRYDMVIAASECGGQPHTNTLPMQGYISNGGTLLATGSQIDWLFGGASMFQNAATWTQSTPESAPYSIDVTSPKGKALAEWANASNLASNGNVSLAGAGGRVGAVKNGTTRLVSSATQTQLLSFRPFGNPLCGRVVYADYEVSGASDAYPFPSRCSTLDSTHAASQALLQPSFFDWSCDPTPIGE